MEKLLQQLNVFLANRFDKVLHSFFGAWIALGGLCLGKAIGFTATCMILAPFAAGIVKEIYDHKHPPHSADTLDILATIIGAVPVWAAYYLGR